MPVLLIGTLDTKGEELRYVRDRLAEIGISSLTLDTGVLGAPAFAADVGREAVFAAAGSSLAEIVKVGDRGQAITAATRGAARVALDLHAQGQVDGARPGRLCRNRWADDGILHR